jgi:enoyl-CoA hydratase
LAICVLARVRKTSAGDVVSLDHPAIEAGNDLFEHEILEVPSPAMLGQGIARGVALQQDDLALVLELAVSDERHVPWLGAAGLGQLGEQREDFLLPPRGDRVMRNHLQFSHGLPFRSIELELDSPSAVKGLTTLAYEVTGRVARIVLDRPERGNGITRRLVSELELCVEQADLDPAVHAILLAGKGKGFCGGYDLVESAEGRGGAGEEDPGEEVSGKVLGEEVLGEEMSGEVLGEEVTGEEMSGDVLGKEMPVTSSADPGARKRFQPPPGSPLDPAVMAANHDPAGTWDPMVDYAMMSRNVRAFMSLFHCGKPVICKVHGFCVAGGTDMALCSDLLVIAADAKIGYPPARVWGSPTTSMWMHRLGPQRAKRLLFTGDSLSGVEALEWGLAIEAPPADRLDERTEILLERIALVPINQLRMMKLLVNQSLYAQGLHSTQALGTLLDGVARHTAEGYAFQQGAMQAGFREAVRRRDEPFGDQGASTFKG